METSVKRQEDEWKGWKARSDAEITRWKVQEAISRLKTEEQERVRKEKASDIMEHINEGEITLEMALVEIQEA